MRTRTVEQIGPELERAQQLGYDLIKTYVRPVEAQREVVERTHRAGLPLSSHYLYPLHRHYQCILTDPT